MATLKIHTTALAVAFGLFAALAHAQDRPRTDTPVYKPPLRGAPASRIGGGTRGPNHEVPHIAVLAPDHVGLTTSEHPTLYWYLSKQAPVRIEVTLLDDTEIKPLLERTLQAPLSPGVQSFSLKELGVTLKPEVDYRWHVALVSDPKQRSADVIASGAIRRISPTDALRAKLLQSGDSAKPTAYAEAGIWYDSLDSLMQLIKGSPEDRRLRSQLTALLSQVGLVGMVPGD